MRLLVALSSHGYGHAAQIAPVINALAARQRLDLILYGDVPEPFLRSRFDAPFRLVSATTDVGLVMTSALDADRDASRSAYERFHARWEQRVAAEESLLAQEAPDLVVADVPYRVLEAAGRAGIASMALCSLSWADVVEAYLDDAAELAATIRACYGRAERFICPEPTAPIAGLSNTVGVGPVARPAQRRRGELRRALGAGPDTVVTLLALGGIPTILPIETWPAASDILWLSPAQVTSAGPGVVSVASVPELARMPFADLQASCDCLLTKPGYNTMVEAACHDVPLVFVRRGDWPEESALIPWTLEHARAVEISRRDLDEGDVAEAVRSATAMAPTGGVTPRGNDEAAALIEAALLS